MKHKPERIQDITDEAAGGKELVECMQLLNERSKRRPSV